MRGKKHSPDNPAEWISRAKSSLALAAATPPGVLYEDLCFQAQQAAEKALKAVFVARKNPYPYTHDINALLSGLEQQGVDIPGQIWEAVTLTSFASNTRYPGTAITVTKEEYHEAIRLAQEILWWAQEQTG